MRGVVTRTGTTSAVLARTDKRRARSFWDDRDVGELAVIGRAHWVKADEVKRVRVRVVAGLEWDDWGVVVGVDEREVVRAHLRETVGVLVDERGLEDRIRRTRWGEVDNGTTIDWRAGHVIRPFVGVSAIADTEEEDLDRVREANVVRWLRGSVWRESLAGRGLDLLNEDVTGRAGHALTLVIRDNRVVRPDLGGAKDWFRRNIGVGADDWDNTEVLRNVIEDEEVRPVAEREVDAHLVIWERRSWEGNTRITAVEEWEGKIEGERWDGNTRRRWTSQTVEVTDHVLVAVALARWDSERRPEIKVVIVKARRNKVIESNAALTDDIVHEVASPAKAAVGAELIGGRIGKGDRWSLEAKPRLEEVITRTRDRYRPFGVEGWGARRTRKDNGNLGEPSRLASLTDEICSRFLTAIHVFFNLVEGGEINETRGYVRCCYRAHVILY